MKRNRATPIDTNPTGELKIGDLIRARRWTNCTANDEFRYSVGKSKDVGMFLYLGTTSFDNSMSLDLETRMMQLGWVRA